MAVTVQDLLNDPRYKDNKSLLLLAKPDVVPPRHRKKKKQKTTRQLISGIQKNILNLQKEVKLIAQRLNRIVELNNLKTE
ncbi:MAG: hypothetical protein KBS35_02295 [Mycoplasma sp.]|nr:hypothetical protein [Candidatus Hennigella equi]